MKKIVNEVIQTSINVEALTGREIVAYRCKESDSVCILSRIRPNNADDDFKNKNWGFINLQYPSSKPTFCGIDFFMCISHVINTRQLMVFDNQKELIEAIYEKAF